MSVWHYPVLIHEKANSRNGMYPSSRLWTRLIEAENHCTAYRHRQVYAKALELGTDVTGVNSLQGRWRFRTGYGVNECTVVMLMGLTDASTGAGSTANPVATVDMTISGGATTTVTFGYAVNTAVGGIVDAPDEHVVMAEDVAVTANTVYECSLTNTGFARPMAIMVYEKAPTTIDEATSYMNTHNPQGGSPIYDADRERILVGLSNMYRANGGSNFHWSLYNLAARTRTSTTPILLIDNSTTGTPATSAPGFYIDSQYRNTSSRTTVPYEFACYGNVAGGGSGTVRLIDDSGNTYCSITVNAGSDAWFTATGNLPTTSGGVFLSPQFYSDGVNSLSIRAVSLIEWEA